MANIQDKVLLDDGVKLLSITVDPAYDTPERLAAYASRFHADPTKWRFVTGASDKVMTLIRKGFMTYTQPDGKLQDNGAPSIAHRADFFLVDGDLHLRGTFEHTDITRIDALIRAARYLARTAN
jgi:protein SCO1/2